MKFQCATEYPSHIGEKRLYANALDPHVHVLKVLKLKAVILARDKPLEKCSYELTHFDDLAHSLPFTFGEHCELVPRAVFIDLSFLPLGRQSRGK